MLTELLATAGATAAAAGGYTYAAMWPASQIFGRTIVAGNDPDEFALTYDDGPNFPETGLLLDLLAKHNVRATFFVIGSYAKQRPEIVRAVASAGHIVGNHTMTHPKLLFCSPQQVRDELAGCNAVLEDILGAPRALHALSLWSPPSRRPPHRPLARIDSSPVERHRLRLAAVHRAKDPRARGKGNRPQSAARMRLQHSSA